MFKPLYKGQKKLFLVEYIRTNPEENTSYYIDVTFEEFEHYKNVMQPYLLNKIKGCIGSEIKEVDLNSLSYKELSNILRNIRISQN